jgi:ParB family transcriptional regulator, chromosome partitioning protein
VAETPSRLGRGLAALLGEASAEPVTTSVTDGGLLRIAVGAIAPNPDQPRRHMDTASLDALTDSIRSSGLVQPIVVRPLGAGAYEIIAGERRWRAARAAGLAEIPALVREADDRERLEFGLIENVVREDLNPLEVARACALLLEDFGLTQGALAERIGRSRPAVSNLLRLLELPESVQALVISGKLTEGHARAILMADGAGARRRLAEAVVAEGLSVRQTERRAGAGRPKRVALDAEPSPTADAATDVFYGTFGAATRVRRTNEGFSVELRFADEAALTQAVERLRALPPISE